MKLFTKIRVRLGHKLFWNHTQQLSMHSVRHQDKSGRCRGEIRAIVVEVCQEQGSGIYIQPKRERERIIWYALIKHWFKRV